MVPWSQVSLGGKLLNAFDPGDPRFGFDRMAMRKKAEENAYLVLGGKKCTEYGISTTLCRVAEIVLHGEKAIIPASMVLDGEYGEHGLCAGVPVLLGENGVEEVIEYDLPEQERRQFHECCDAIRHNMTLDDSVIRNCH
jgi:L-lactate dehydrogenase